MAKPRRRRRRISAKRVGPVAAAWFGLGALVMGVAAIIQSVTMLVVAVISLLIAGLTLLAGGGRAGVPATPRRPANTAKPGGKPRAATRKPTQTRRGTVKCTARCQRSSQPAADCDCSCGGRWHGSQRTGTRAALLRPEAKRREKAVVQGRRRNVIDD